MELAGLQQLVKDYGSLLYSFCYQLTGTQQESEELYQETFLKAVELHERIDLERNPKGFLIAIAARLWKNRKRKYAWRQRIAPKEHIEDEILLIRSLDAVDNPEEMALREEQRQMVCQAVSALSDKLKVPLYMYYTAELSVAEIAEMLHIPQGTVKSRLHKARNQLKKELEVQWNEA